MSRLSFELANEPKSAAKPRSPVRFFAWLAVLVALAIWATIIVTH
jgi:hypothetical protein